MNLFVFRGHPARYHFPTEKDNLDEVGTKGRETPPRQTPFSNFGSYKLHVDDPRVDGPDKQVNEQAEAVRLESREPEAGLSYTAAGLRWAAYSLEAAVEGVRLVHSPVDHPYPYPYQKEILKSSKPN